ncbi:MAG: S8/S53 family peptidase [Bacteroidota bacterium]
MKRIVGKALAALVASGLLLASCSKDSNLGLENHITSEETQPTHLTAEQVDDYIIETIKRTEDSFDWSEASDEVMWAATRLSDEIVVVGYKPESWSDEDARDYMFTYEEGKSLSDEVLQAKKGILSALNIDETADLSEYIVNENDNFMSLHLKINDIASLKALRTSKYVRYVDATYHPAPSQEEGVVTERSDLSRVGCYPAYPDFSLRENYDYAHIHPRAKISWNYRYHKIKEAWERGGVTGKGTGKGIGIAMLDTGLALNQQSLSTTSGLNGGYVRGRSIDSWNFLDRWQTVDDFCGHGTNLTGVVGAPRRGLGAMVGVAYGSNLYSFKVTEGVLIRGSNVINAVANGYGNAGRRHGVRIINLCMGNIVRIHEVADAIVYAYRKGKLNFVAAGTHTHLTDLTSYIPSLSRIVFPANMTEYGGDVVLGISGINTHYQRCSECVQGPNVDFVVVMEQMNGTFPLGMSRYSNFPTQVGGSSVATATMSGIAAIVWGKTPTRPRADVVRALRATSDFPNGNNPIFGHGKANALAAWNRMPW